MNSINNINQSQGIMNAIVRPIRAYPLAAFFILAYALSWWSVPLSGGQLIPYGPAVAAVIVLALSEGRTGLTGLWRQMTRWRVGWRWYLIAPGIMVAIHLSALALNLLLGANITDVSRLLSLSFMVPLVMESILLGGMWEEPGWSGYALPKLQTRFAGRPGGLLTASLVLAAFRTVWHLPFLIYGQTTWFHFLFYAVAFQFIITWLYNRTGGSVLIVMLFHLTSNVVGGGIMRSLFTGSDYMQYQVLFVGFGCLAAFLLARLNGWSIGAAVEGDRQAVVIP